MTYAERRNLALILLAAFIAILLLTACGTTHNPLPAYEAPLAKTDFQHVRTTAYTHTESDHRQYSNHNALGGELHAAGPPIGAARADRGRLPAPTAVPAFSCAFVSEHHSICPHRASRARTCAVYRCAPAFGALAVRRGTPSLSPSAHRPLDMEASVAVCDSERREAPGQVATASSYPRLSNVPGCHHSGGVVGTTLGYRAGPGTSPSPRRW